MEGDKHEQQSPVRPGLYRGVQRLRQLYAEGFISKEEVAMTLSCNAGFCRCNEKSTEWKGGYGGQYIRSHQLGVPFWVATSCGDVLLDFALPMIHYLKWFKWSISGSSIAFRCNIAQYHPQLWLQSKSMPTKTQHNTMSALVDKPKEYGNEVQLKPRGEWRRWRSGAPDRLPSPQWLSALYYIHWWDNLGSWTKAVVDRVIE